MTAAGSTPKDHKPEHGSVQLELCRPRITTSSERILIRLRIWLGCNACKNFGSAGVCRFGPRSLIKFTCSTRAAEAANLLYIARHTTVPVPRVHDVFTIGQQTFIVMEYVHGTELTYAWEHLSAEQKMGLFPQLKDYIDQVRSLQPPRPGRVEAADGTSLFDVRLCMGNQPFGPFATVTDFHTHLGHDCIRAGERHRDVWTQFEAVAKRQYRTVFTHSDIAPRNILVKGGRITAIVDWEAAGWYPEYWEYCRWAVSNYRSSQLWHEMRDTVLDVYPAELHVEDYLDSVYTRL
ncbi:kinase-like domain-containing protein [Hygrophoropsis aurantiaca]|uniref:Kinase-like domain-containing protein n=1 Tax=Hygrophoropsis aurantiaca TaxID=72124 RepID=A0ACB8AIP0_9AGAM|nr:kinase-like domain-containing protein [Hygrophoropsis aurantiaca]